MVGLTNHDFLIMIIDNKRDLIDNKPFDKYFVKRKIKY